MSSASPTRFGRRRCAVWTRLLRSRWTLVALRPSELRSFRNSLEGRLKPATIDATIALLAMLLRAAVQDGLLDKSPMPRQTGGSASRTVDPAELLTIEQLRAWDAKLPEYARGMALVAAQTGLRQGERCSACRCRRWTSCAGRSGSRSSWCHGWAPGRPRSGRRRQLRGCGRCRCLRRRGRPWLSRCAGSRRPWGSRSTWGRVVVDGGAPRSGTCTGRRRARRDLPAWAHWHGLRDVALSGVIRAGVDVRTVMAIAGHASPDETLRVYARMWSDSSDNARLAGESLWAAPQAAQREARLHEPRVCMAGARQLGRQGVATYFHTATSSDRKLLRYSR